MGKSISHAHVVDRHDKLQWQAKLKRDQWLSILQASRSWCRGGHGGMCFCTPLETRTENLPVIPGTRSAEIEKRDGGNKSSFSSRILASFCLVFTGNFQTVFYVSPHQIARPIRIRTARLQLESAPREVDQDI